MTLSFLVTRRELSLGAQDTVTGWYAKSYAETADYDKIVIVPKGFNLTQFGIGSYAKYATTGIICAPLSEGDEIIANSKYYDVASVEDVDLGNSHMWYVCELHENQMHYDAPTTYGTGATVEDPRHRTKDYLDTYLLAANLLENDGGTQAEFITCWANPPYPIKKVFVTKGIDLIFSIGRQTSTPQIGHDKYAFGYKEKVSIMVEAIDKTGISGDNLMWQGEAELRRVVETYPIGSLRNLETMNPKTQNLGSTTLYSVECILDYTRNLT